MATGQAPKVRKTRDEVFQARVDRLSAKAHRYRQLAGDAEDQIRELVAEWERFDARRT